MEAGEQLKKEIKELIVEVLSLDDVTPEEIGDEEALFIEGLGLDSIDALELSLAIEKRFGIKIRNEELGQKVLYSVESIATHIAESAST
ncbi:MAG: acyl carrier protein [Deltaproteobacteria bacterium]|nr:acyl carrier protein [Deltaproteobacteria bacterium]